VRARALLAVALADAGIVAVYCVVAWAVWQITHPRIPAPIAWAATLAILGIGVGGYARHALPWWRKVLP
jgi:uncharacterized membrane protein YqjE